MSGDGTRVERLMGTAAYGGNGFSILQFFPALSVWFSINSIESTN